MRHYNPSQSDRRRRSMDRLVRSLIGGFRAGRYGREWIEELEALEEDPAAEECGVKKSTLRTIWWTVITGAALRVFKILSEIVVRTAA